VSPKHEGDGRGGGNARKEAGEFEGIGREKKKGVGTADIRRRKNLATIVKRFKKTFVYGTRQRKGKEERPTKKVISARPKRHLNKFCGLSSLQWKGPREKSQIQGRPGGGRPLSILLSAIHHQ